MLQEGVQKLQTEIICSFFLSVSPNSQTLEDVMNQINVCLFIHPN